MKNLVALLTAVLSLGAFAQERLVLNQKEISARGAEAIVVRTSRTPETVKITFSVPMANRICEQYATRPVRRLVPYECGRTEIRTRNHGRICVRTNPYNGECLNWKDDIRTEAVFVSRTCHREVIEMETYCARYGTSVSNKLDSMKIKFKKLPSLGGTEEETFLIRSTQEHYDGRDVEYDVKPLQTLRPYKVKRSVLSRLFDGDTYVVED